MTNSPNITADPIALQERDEFRETGWLKVLAPAKINLHLAIGPRRPDGYHDVSTVMHTLTLHDTLYAKLTPPPLPRSGGSPALADDPLDPTPTSATPRSGGSPALADDPLDPTSATPRSGVNSTMCRGELPLAQARSAACPNPEPRLDPPLATCHMIPTGTTLPEIPPADNLATRAITALATRLDPTPPPITLRIEKSIPAQAGLGGGSSDAAAALIAAARLWNLAPDDPRIEQTARTLGADVAFFLHAPCAYLEGAGDEFAHSLAPARQPLVLVKPDAGVPTADAYRAFDEDPAYATAAQSAQVAAAQCADEIRPYNNLAPAAERILPELAEIRAWLEADPRTRAVLLCGSGATTFALCETWSDACALATEARTRGAWSRATTLSPAPTPHGASPGTPAPREAEPAPHGASPGTPAPRETEPEAHGASPGTPAPRETEPEAHGASTRTPAPREAEAEVQCVGASFRSPSARSADPNPAHPLDPAPGAPA